MRILIILSVLLCPFVFSVHYEPNWQSIDSRPLPTWYDESKLGIFMHWGVYSVPSFYSEWFWYRWQTTKIPEVVDFMEKNYPPSFSYADFAKQFTNEFFNASVVEEIVRASGAK
jgi:alpha-L-fucosidase